MISSRSEPGTLRSPKRGHTVAFLETVIENEGISPGGLEFSKEEVIEDLMQKRERKAARATRPKLNPVFADHSARARKAWATRRAKAQGLPPPRQVPADALERLLDATRGAWAILMALPDPDPVQIRTRDRLAEAIGQVEEPDPFDGYDPGESEAREEEGGPTL